MRHCTDSYRISDLKNNDLSGKQYPAGNRRAVPPCLPLAAREGVAEGPAYMGLLSQRSASSNESKNTKNYANNAK